MAPSEGIDEGCSNGLNRYLTKAFVSSHLIFRKNRINYLNIYNKGYKLTDVGPAQPDADGGQKGKKECIFRIFLQLRTRCSDYV